MGKSYTPSCESFISWDSQPRIALNILLIHCRTRKECENILTCGQFRNSIKISQIIGNIDFPKCFVLSRIQLMFIKHILSFLFAVTWLKFQKWFNAV